MVHGFFGTIKSAATKIFSKARSIQAVGLASTSTTGGTTTTTTGTTGATGGGGIVVTTGGTSGGGGGIVVTTGGTGGFKEQPILSQEAIALAGEPTDTIPGSRTIQEQIPSQIGLPPSSFERALALGTEGKKPSVKFESELFKRAGREFFFQGGTPVTAAETLISPFQRFFPGRKQEQEFFTPQFGTISTEQPTGFKVTTPTKTRIEQALLDPSLVTPSGEIISTGGGRIQRELVEELQPRVTSGELTITQAEKQFEESFSQRFEQEIEPILGKKAEFTRGLISGQQPVFDVAKAGGFAAIGLGSLTPVGAAIIGTSFVAEGLPKLTGGETFVEKGLGAVEIGFGFAGGGIAVRGAERIADIGLLQELQSTRAVITGKEIARGEARALFDIKSLRQLGTEGKIDTELVFPVFRTSGEKFVITGGRGRSSLEFFSTEKGKVIKGVEDFGFGGRQTTSQEVPKIISKDLSVGLEEFTGSFGRGFIQKRGQETFTEFGFGGISKDIETQFGRFTSIKGGKITGLKFEGITKLRKGGFTFETAKGKIPIEEVGIIKRLSISEGEGVQFISPAKIKKTPFQVTFQELKIPAPTGVSTGIEEQLFQPTQIIKQTPKISRSLIGIPRSIGGQGLELLGTSELRQFGLGFRPGFVQQDIQVGGILPPRIGGGSVQLDFIKTKEKQIGVLDLGIEKVSIKESVIPAVMVGQIQRTGLIEATVSKQRFDQPFLMPRTSPADFFTPFERGGFKIPRLFPPLPSLGGRPARKKKKKSKKAKAIIKPSFTGIVLGIEEAPEFISPTLGIVPGQIRGLETGFNVPKKKKKKGKKIVKKRKKKKK